jgi:formylglycine-generating enzyme required for sulfatase activity
MNVRPIIVAAIVGLAVAFPAQAITLRCPPDSVKVGNTCVDTYEASLWRIDPANVTLVRKVQTGRVTLADLQAGGATALSLSACSAMDVFTNFPRSGNWTAVPGSNPPSPGFYAVSVAGVQPSRCITWFQANQACLLSGKRLLTNREWQGAAAGTPDPDAADDGSTTCVTTGAEPANTGSRSSCKSVWGAFDMIGNVNEWVGDWADRSVSCTNWPASLGGDFSCLGGPGTTGSPDETSGTLSFPGAFVRGGGFVDRAGGGVFAIDSGANPLQRSDEFGFRCAR